MFKGVSFVKGFNKYKAYIGIDNKQLNLGHYDSKEEAIEARKLASDLIFKEFQQNE